MRDRDTQGTAGGRISQADRVGNGTEQRDCACNGQRGAVTHSGFGVPGRKVSGGPGRDGSHDKGRMREGTGNIGEFLSGSKAVRKDEKGVYRSDWSFDFTYEIGKKKKEKCDPDVNDNCSYGIHISHLNWALNFGNNWSNLAILEVETKISDIVLPKNTDGKVRTSEVKVLREVPLEECGVYGKMLAKRRKRDGNN